MRYLKRLKNELQALTEKLTVKGSLPEYVSNRKVNRLEILPLVIALVHQARALDEATEEWAEEHVVQWHEYIVNLKHWLGQAPKPPKAGNGKVTPIPKAVKKETEGTSLKCKVSSTDSGYEILFTRLRTIELQSVRNAMVIHAAHTQEGKDILAGMLEALNAAGIDTGEILATR